MMTVTATTEGRHRISVEARTSSRSTIETRYPRSLIGLIAEVVGEAFVCDEIARDEDPAYVAQSLLATLDAYVAKAPATVLDFGCGMGSSTMILARRYPSARLLGVEVDAELLRVAEARATYYRVGERVSFYVSPSGDTLPPLPGVDLIVLSGVVEHLLPSERGRVLSDLWKLLPSGGVLVIDQTPNRAFPVEMHTTRLPGLNYVPDWVAQRLARLSRYERTARTWEERLRRGIRGTTVRALQRTLPDATLIRPAGMDRIDLWMLEKAPTRARRAIARVAKVLQATTNVVMVPTLQLGFRKHDRGSHLDCDEGLLRR
jgi:predicted O-methyltransferase YrrM